jgi:hypothetical protein
MLCAMLSEWLKIMLEEIARKNAAAEQALLEPQRRGQAPAGQALPEPDRATG